MKKIKTIGMFGAARDKISNEFKTTVCDLGESLAREGYELYYGAGDEGLMGAMARGFTKGNGKIIGVTPDFMETFEPLYKKCDKLVITNNMEERKQFIKRKSDAFIVCPGGVGTMDEFFEVLTDKQLHLHDKPILLYNIDGYFDKMLDMINFYIEGGFIGSGVLKKFTVVNSIKGVKIALCLAENPIS